MSPEMFIGKTYNLKFHLNDLTELESISGNYRLIVKHILPWGENNSKEYKFMLFENKKGTVVEVFIDDNSYMSLLFSYNNLLVIAKFSDYLFLYRDTFVTTEFTDYLEHGNYQFPKFGVNKDIYAFVDIKEEQSEQRYDELDKQKLRFKGCIIS